MVDEPDPLDPDGLNPFGGAPFGTVPFGPAPEQEEEEEQEEGGDAGGFIVLHRAGDERRFGPAFTRTRYNAFKRELFEERRVKAEARRRRQIKEAQRKRRESAERQARTSANLTRLDLNALQAQLDLLFEAEIARIEREALLHQQQIQNEQVAHMAEAMRQMQAQAETHRRNMLAAEQQEESEVLELLLAA